MDITKGIFISSISLLSRRFSLDASLPRLCHEGYIKATTIQHHGMLHTICRSAIIYFYPYRSFHNYLPAQFSLNNVHKRGLKHHHFIIISRSAEGPGREILQCPRLSVTFSFRTVTQKRIDVFSRNFAGTCTMSWGCAVQFLILMECCFNVL